MSILVTIETDLGKVGHAFVLGAEKTKAALIWAAGEEPKLAADAAVVESLANNFIVQVYPGAGLVAAAIEAVFGKALDAVVALGDAASSDALNIQLDTAAVAAVKAALPVVQAQAKTTPGS